MVWKRRRRDSGKVGVKVGGVVGERKYRGKEDRMEMTSRRRPRVAMKQDVSKRGMQPIPRTKGQGYREVVKASVVGSGVKGKKIGRKPGLDRAMRQR